MDNVCCRTRFICHGAQRAPNPVSDREQPGTLGAGAGNQVAAAMFRRQKRVSNLANAAGPTRALP